MRTSRIAAIYDIHGNLPALQAVLAEIRRERIDRILVGGDVFPGPMPRECLEELLAIAIPTDFIRGNGDREVLARMRGMETGTVPERFRPVIDWVAGQLRPEHEAVIASWPPTTHLRIDGMGEVLFCHATPRNDTEIFVRTTPEEQIAPAFDGVDATLVVCGHTHMQFDRMVGAMRIVNAGSVGMPFGEPGAYWVLLDADVHLRHTSYDLANAARRIRATGYPQAEEFAARDLLAPPSEQDMIARFASVALR